MIWHGIINPPHFNIKHCIRYGAYMSSHNVFMITSSHGNIFRVTVHFCGEFTGHRWIPSQRPVTRSFDVFFDLRQNKRLSKRSWGLWFETPSHPLWRHCNVSIVSYAVCYCETIWIHVHLKFTAVRFQRRDAYFNICKIYIHNIQIVNHALSFPFMKLSIYCYIYFNIEKTTSTYKYIKLIWSIAALLGCGHTCIIRCYWNRGMYQPIYSGVPSLTIGHSYIFPSLVEPMTLFDMGKINSLWPSDDIWWQNSGSTLSLVMACCLTASNHYLNNIDSSSYLQFTWQRFHTKIFWTLSVVCVQRLHFQNYYRVSQGLIMYTTPTTFRSLAPGRFSWWA